MLKKILLPTIYLVFTYGFWISPNFNEIAAGVAIFLFGMLSLEQGFKSLAGGTLENILRKATSTKWKSVGFGVVSTSLMQSSSLVSVITISFLSAGLINLASGIGIIFGANLGTTTGAWLIAGFGLKVKISSYALPLLVFGIIGVFHQSKSIKGIGYILTGLGFLFLGIHHMKVGLDAFKDTVALTQLAMPGFLGLITYIAFGVLATVLMQSSHATLVLTITALSANQISYENALALAIGSNIGTTITAVIGSMSANEQGKRLALAHVLFNVITALIAVLFIQQLISLTDSLSQFFGIQDNDFTLKLAVFHSLFNVIGIMVMLPFTKKLEAFLTQCIKTTTIDVANPRYLEQSALDFPETAVEVIRKESSHLYQNSIEIILQGLCFKPEDLTSKLVASDMILQRKKVNDFDIDVAYAKNIKNIYSGIIEFISHAGFTWKMTQSGDIYWLRQANLRLVEAIKDIKHMRKNLTRVLPSNNKVLIEEYQQIRVMLLQIIRSIETLRNAVELPSLSNIDDLNLTIKTQYNKLNQDLSRLIRDGEITPIEGTSLMNDATYAFDIGKNLIKASETLFVRQRKNIEKKDHEQSYSEFAINRSGG